MPRKAKTNHAILGLLCWKPMSGYDIKRLVDVALSYFWSGSYGQIFPILNRLVADGLATRRVDPESGGRRRQVYSATAAGRRAFHAWMQRPSEQPRLRDEIKLKFFLCSKGEPADGIRLLEEYQRQQREHLELLQHSEALFLAALGGERMPDELLQLESALGWGEQPDPRQHASELLTLYLTLRSGILVTEARLAWVAEALPLLTASASGTAVTPRQIKAARPRDGRRGSQTR